MLPDRSHSTRPDPGLLAGRYRLTRLIGSGASSLVFEADDEVDGARRAVKVLRALDERALVEGEFRALSRLSHPALVHAHGLGRVAATQILLGETLTAGAPFLVLDLVNGRSIAALLRETPPEQRSTLLAQTAASVAEALVQLHGAGLVHRDIKPDNLVVAEDGQVVLVDLGLSSGARSADAVRGTPAYMAPEALVGVADPRTDLYALGVTLYELASGRRPFDAEGPALVNQILQQPIERVACSWLDDALGSTIVRLLRKDPLQRPQSSRALLVELLRSLGQHDRASKLASKVELLPPAFVGRVAEVRQLVEALGGARRPSAVLVSGEAGTGKTALVREAERRYQLRVAGANASPLTFYHGPLRALAPRREGDLASQAGSVVEAVLRRAEQHPLALHLERESGDPLLDRVVQGLAAALVRQPDRPLTLIVESRAAEPVHELSAHLRLDWVQVHTAPLDGAALAQLMQSMRGSAPSAEDLSRVLRQSAGIPALAIESVRLAWATAGAANLETSELPGQVFAALVERRREALDARSRGVIDALAVWEEEASPAQVAGLLGVSAERVERALLALSGRGEIERQGDTVRLSSRGYAEAWRGAIAPAERAALHQRAAALCDKGAPRRAEHLVEAWSDDPARAPRWEVFIEAGRQLAAEGELPRAIRLVEGAQQRTTDARRGKQALDQLLAQLYVQAGSYDAALALLEDARGAGARLLRAEALQRRGDYQEAEALLRRLVQQRRAEIGTRARVLLGRLLLRQGRPSEALEVCPLPDRLQRGAKGETLTNDELGAIEIAGLAQLQLGDGARADRLFGIGLEALREQGPRAQLARFEGLRGMAAFRGGRLREAAEHYQRAVDAARLAGDLHGLATYVGNLGSAELEMGRYEASLAHLIEAEGALERLGRTTELASALCNRAGLALLLGDLEHAESLRRRAQSEADRAGSRLVVGYAALTTAEILRRTGHPLEAVEGYRSARPHFEAAEASWEVTLCRLGEVEALLEAGRGAAAAECMSPISAQYLTAEPADDPLRVGRVALTAARVALQSAEQRGHDTSLHTQLARYAATLESRGARSELWRVAAVLAALLEHQGRSRGAKLALRRARQSWEDLMGEAPEAYREQMKDDPDARALSEQWERMVGDAAAATEAPRSVALRAPAHDDRRMRRLLAINKRLNSELRLDPLLETVMDAAIELTDAERGFLILVEDDQLQVKVARNIDRRSLETDELALSRSIAQKTARSGEPVVTVDAAEDARFSGALSVSDLHLRSVLAVPLRVKASVVGTLYVDHRLRRGAFEETDVQLLQDLADQAAIAIDNARLVAENERRRAQIEELNRGLSAQVETQAAELDEVKEELRSSKHVLQVRNDYSSLVGRSTPMLQLFRLLDRVTDNDLPVVIFGESGTGKELVARAIHDNGPRATRTFVGENCGAIPETLLESVLFGAKRGAFTGADRDRKGLFEIADGGTLLLDEVSAMSPAMQTKLLRVLQDGDLRPVGAEKTVTVDVRVIAASNEELAELVEKGRFREDLFYRLNVVRIGIPALRERREDIPLLVQHFLTKHAGGRQVRLSKAALARLIDHRWPGNVRELENEVMRLSAMAGDVIGPDDLSPQIVGDDDPRSRAPDDGDLSLKPRVQRLERELIHRALEQTSGNQSRAARLLGLSRYGLLKKLKRYFPQQYGG